MTLAPSFTVSYLSRRYGIDIRAKIRPCEKTGRPVFHVVGLVDRHGQPLPDTMGGSVQEAFGPIVEECLRRERAAQDWTPT
jgi:hypothetical protein